MARALRFTSNIPKLFWGDCVLTATYIINRLPTKILNGKSPFELLFGVPPTISHLRVFGCLCFSRSTASGKDKMDPRGIPCLFLGYPYGHKGYKLLSLQSNKIIVSRHVQFFEDIFPYQQIQSTAAPTNTQLTSAIVPLPNPDDSFNDDLDRENSSISVHSPCPDSSPPPSAAESAGPTEATPSATSPITDSIAQPSPILPPSAAAPQIQPLRKSTRLTTAPARYKDYTSFTSKNQKKKSNIHTIANYVSYVNCSASHALFLASLNTFTEPSCYSKAKSDPLWREAMHNEISALEKNNTWIISDLPSDKSPIQCKWIYKIKLNSDGSLERYKARLVAKGFTQIPDIDYHETFAPVAKMPTIRCLLAVAAKKNWTLHQLDVHNAFLNGDLDEEIYMTLPPGFYSTEKSKGKVCRLLKSLYGLKQACRQWFSKFSEALIHFGFVQSLLDYSLFTYHKGQDSVILLVYVDDIVITGNSPTLISEVKAFINSKFHTKDLGHLKYFLGLEIARSNSGIFVNQRKYIMDILTTYDLLDCKPAKSPMDPKQKLILSEAPPMTDPTSYRQLIGKLVYLSITRPDISYSVHVLSQFLKTPTNDHMQAAYHLLRYLKNAPAQGVFFSSVPDFTLRVYCDADWAACPVSRRSITGHCTTLGGSLLSWKTKKQSVISRSSAESEYRAIAAATSEALWFEAVLREIGAPVPRPVLLFCDNTAAVQIARNPVHHERTKHIEVDIHFVRHHVASGLIKIAHVRSDQQPADLLTKPLPVERIRRLMATLDVSNFLHHA